MSKNTKLKLESDDKDFDSLINRYVEETNTARLDFAPKLRKFLNGHIYLRILESDEHWKTRIFYDFANNGACYGELDSEGRFLTDRTKLERYFVNKISCQIIDENPDYYSFLNGDEKQNERKTSEKYKKTDKMVTEIVKKNKTVEKFLDTIDDEAESYLRKSPVQYFVAHLPEW